MKRYSKILSLLLALCMVFTMLPAGVLAAEAKTVGIESEDTLGLNLPKGATLADKIKAINSSRVQAEKKTAADGLSAKELTKIDADLKRQADEDKLLDVETYADSDMVNVIVVLEDESLLDQGYTKELIAENGSKISAMTLSLESKQETVLRGINEIVRSMASEVDTYALDETPVVEAKYNYTIAISGMAVTVPYGALEAINGLKGVDKAFVAPQYELPEDMTRNAVKDPRTHVTQGHFGTEAAWNLGYTGKGMRIAIIDSGLDIDHPAFAEVPPLTENSLGKEELNGVVDSLHAATRYKLTTGSVLTADSLYRSGKIPYAFNYVDGSLDATHDNDDQGDHGTHVAGIAVSNRTDINKVAGVAPDAQVLALKVFGVNGGGDFGDILAALEDCFKLNVDAVNMSLGSPAGFSRDPNEYANEVYAKIKDTDMVVAISAGNSASSAEMNQYGTDHNQTKDPDNGIMGSPAAYYGSTVVASLENTHVMYNYLVVGGQNVPFSDVGAIPFTGLAGRPYEYVMVPGYGAPEDYDGLSVRGKIAVVSRGGGVDFTSKQTNAYNAGAAAILVYDNVVGELINMMDAKVIRNAAVTMESGKLLAENAVNGEGTLEVMPKDVQMTSPNPVAGEMSGFSSWGATPDLQLRPDVTAPGGQIYSTLTNGKYGVMSGTSMAAPHIAGMSAVVLQYLRETHPELTEGAVHLAAEGLVMSTAKPVLEATGLPYSPRKQGAGEANVYDAITSPAYLSVDGDSPKISLYDDPQREGKYSFSFEVNNFSREDLVYVLNGQTLTDDVDLTYASEGYYFMSETSRALNAQVDFSSANSIEPLMYDADQDGDFDRDDVQYHLDSVNDLNPALPNEPFDLTGDGLQDTADTQALYELLRMVSQSENAMIRVPAGETATVNVSVVLTDADKAYMDKYYENGIYVDGFVRCYALGENTVDLSLPFMGFYGNWSDARIFDTGWYYQSEEEAEFYHYPHMFITQYGQGDFLLGLNPYVASERYDASHNVMSPNGDEYLDKFNDIYISMLRAAKELRFTWEDENGEILFQESAEFVRKTCYYPQYGISYPFIYGANMEREYDFTKDGQPLPNGTKLTLKIEGFLDYRDDVVDETMEIPVVIDTEKPRIELVSYDADAHKVTVRVSDNYNVAAVMPLTSAGQPYKTIPVEGEKAGEWTEVTFDITGYDETFTVAVGDYGCNEAYLELSFSGDHTVLEDSFYAYRRFCVVDGGQYLFPTTANNGWVSFPVDDATDMLLRTAQFESGETAVAAAEHMDGYTLGVDVSGKIFAIAEGQWNRTELGDFIINGQPYDVLDMTFDYTTKTLFALTDEREAGKGGYLVKMDYLTGAVLEAVPVTGMPDKSQALTLACDNDGVLYTIDYVSGDLYTLSTSGAATRVGATGYAPRMQQTMAVDHDTNELYWLAYQGYTGKSGYYKVNKSTGELTLVSQVKDNGEIVALYKPYDFELYPDAAALTGLRLNETRLALNVGKTANLVCSPAPFYAEMGEVTWTSSNESVAKVENGLVTSVGEGEAKITATAKGITATCDVVVSAFAGDMVIYGSGDTSAWLKFNAENPADAEIMENATNLPANGFSAAAYYEGNVYAFGLDKNFYKLNAATMEGVKLDNVANNVVAMAYNYVDGYFYAIELKQNMDETYVYLCRVNPANGQLQRMHALSENDYNGPFGSAMNGLAIDYEGNFYLGTMNNRTRKAEIIRFNLRDDLPETGEDMTDAVDMDTVTATEVSGVNFQGLSAMTYSGDNSGLFCADATGDLFWVDHTRIGRVQNTQAVSVGKIAYTNPTGFNLGLVMVNESQLPENDRLPVDASMNETFLILEGGSVNVNVSVEPWNAARIVNYSIDNENIATVDSDGNVTGVKTGVATLAANVQLESGTKTVSAKVFVRPSTGALRGFLAMDYSYNAGDLWMTVQDADPSKMELGSLGYDYTLTAGAYYNGSLYAVGQGNDGSFYFLQIDPRDYSYETITRVDYNVLDMAFDYTSGTMFAVVQGGQLKGALAQVDLQTGEFAVLPDCGQSLMSLSCDDRGHLFSVTDAGHLYELNKQTGGASLVGSTGAKVGHIYQSMHYDYNTGNTYWANVDPELKSSLRLVDTNNGSSTNIGGLNAGAAVVTAMFTVPNQEPAVPETMDVWGVQLPARNAVAKGETVALKAHVLPISEAKVDETLTWTSSDESVAVVDENGVVTGVELGTVTITAAAANGKTASCQVEVTGGRAFYAYDETNHQWISFERGNTTKVDVMRKDKAGEAPIAASAYTGEVLYAFDTQRNFYRVDTASFERTKLGQISEYVDFEVFHPVFGGNMPLSSKVLSIVDMSYDNGVLYAVLDTYEEDMMEANIPIIAEVDPVDGTLKVVKAIWMEIAQPTNLLVLNNKAYFVDGYISGILNSIGLDEDSVALEPGEKVSDWGEADNGRSFIRDELTDTIYIVRDLGTGSILHTINLSSADLTTVGEIGQAIRINSLFLKGAAAAPKERNFYAYDETGREWVTFPMNDPAAASVVREDKAGETRLTASAHTGEALYAFDAERNFYSVDTKTFERTKLGDVPQYVEFEVFHPIMGGFVPLSSEIRSVVDMSYDNGVLYALLDTYEADMMEQNVPIIAEVDPANGSLKVVKAIWTEYAEPANLLMLDGTAYFVDSLENGMLYSLGLDQASAMEPVAQVSQWGNASDGRGMIRDAETGIVYVVRDLGSGSELHTLNLNDAALASNGEIGQGRTVNSLFIQ